MTDSLDAQQFAKEWAMAAKEIVQTIYEDEVVQGMRADYLSSGRLTLEQQSEFISIANRVKYEVLHKLHGADGTPEFEQFQKAWRHWYDHKGTKPQENRRLTNEEHIIYSSTPDAEEFFENFTR